MHIINSVTVSNYRSIVSEKFVISSYSPFVGYNNAGKSNVLRAISWLLKKTTLIATDFNNVDRPVIVHGNISGVTAELLDKLEQKHRDKIAPYVLNGNISLRRVQPTPSCPAREITLEIKDPNERDKWVPNPTGIDQAISAMFPDPISISAMQDAAEDVTKFGTKTTVGQLLSEIIGLVTV